MLIETQVGPLNLAAGSNAILRSDRSAATTVVEGHARFQDAVYNGNVFGFSGSCTTAGAGQVMAGAAAAALNFIIWNPVGSGKNLVLWQFNCGLISGAASTLQIGAIWHQMMNTAAVSIATGWAGQYGAYNMGGTPAKPVANTLFSAGGTAFTGGTAPFPLYMANFGVSLSSAQTAAVAFPISTVDLIDGKIVIPQGMGWLPTPNVTNATQLYAYSVIWEEIPV